MSDRDIIVRYLLGEASEEERSEFEERLFGDQEFFDGVLEVETDLLDAYAAGELTPAEREGVRRTLLRSVTGNLRLANSRTFVSALAQKPRRRTGIPWGWFAASIVLLIALGAAFDDLRLRSRMQKVQVTTPKVESMKTAMPRAAIPPIFSTMLTPGTTRGSSQVRRVTLPPGSRAIELQLDLEGTDGRLFQAALSTTRGMLVAQFNGLAPTAGANVSSISVWLPADLLAAGRYELALSTSRGEPVDYYYFEITAP